MDNYTIVYVENWNSGSHRHTLVKFYNFEVPEEVEDRKQFLKDKFTYVFEELGEPVYIFRGGPLVI